MRSHNSGDEIKQTVIPMQSDDIQKAEYTLRELLISEPDNVDALKVLGLISYNRKEYDQALDYIEKALRIHSNDARIHYLAGNILTGRKQFDKAILHYQEAVKIDPFFAEAFNNMGLLFQETGRYDDAISCFKKTLSINSSHTDSYYNLGTVYQDKKLYDEAATFYRKALTINQHDADAHYNLAMVLRESHKLGEALEHYHKALFINPQLADSYNNIGIILSDLGRHDEAIAMYRKALDISPDVPDFYNNLALSLKELGRFDDALKNLQLAIQKDPASVKALNNIAVIYLDQGKLGEAEACLRKVLKHTPYSSVIHSSLLFIMNYDPSCDARTIFTEHNRYSEKFERPFLSKYPYFTNDRTPNRRLRIGYVSPDFRRHSVAYFIEPVLSAHNRDRYEIFCYSDVLLPDEVTKRIQGYADHWENIAGMSDELVSEMIRGHRIDILIDLAGHTAKNRMLLFARKPAPIQITWIGYPATTGLSAMDYKIVDHHTDPPGLTEQFYTEQLIRMPDSFLSYLPDRESPDIGSLPSQTKGVITFGSFNNFSKMSDAILGTWSRLLKQLPGSRLILKSQALTTKAACDRVIDIFAIEGVPEERIEFMAFVPSVKKHLDLYNTIDIALDTYPYHGTTTTCEALYMGVPVITLAGNTHVSRVGVSLLSNVGLPELIAGSHEEYITRAVHLATDMNRLLMLRKNLRDMMALSPLCDKQRIDKLEHILREIWRNWCKKNAY